MAFTYSGPCCHVHACSVQSYIAFSFLSVKADAGVSVHSASPFVTLTDETDMVPPLDKHDENSGECQEETCPSHYQPAMLAPPVSNNDQPASLELPFSTQNHAPPRRMPAIPPRSECIWLHSVCMKSNTFSFNSITTGYSFKLMLQACRDNECVK